MALWGMAGMTAYSTNIISGNSQTDWSKGKKSGKLFAKIVQIFPVPIFSGGITCTQALITPLHPVLYTARMA